MAGKLKRRGACGERAGREGAGARGLFGQPVREAQDQEIVRVVALAHRLARRHLTPHAHKFAPKKFTRAAALGVPHPEGASGVHVPQVRGDADPDARGARGHRHDRNTQIHHAARLRGPARDPGGARRRARVDRACDHQAALPGRGPRRHGAGGHECLGALHFQGRTQAHEVREGDARRLVGGARA